MASLGEFDIIQKFFTPTRIDNSNIVIGVGDDAAILDIPSDQQLVSSIDTLVAGVHFPLTTAAADIGYKSLAVSLSDLAAMGASPLGVLLALTLPHADEIWLEQFAQGFFELAEQSNIALIGGDTTHGPLTISTVVHGLVPKGQAILRSGAKVGDLIFVTGSLGDAGMALRDSNFLLQQRLNRPTPRLEIGLLLRNVATTAIDVSDGLAIDLKRILRASKVGAQIETKHLPLSSELQQACDRDTAIQLALSAGDDYELCFTVPPNKVSELEKRIATQNCPVTCIGEINSSMELAILDENGQKLSLVREGYDHFK